MMENFSTLMIMCSYMIQNDSFDEHLFMKTQWRKFSKVVHHL